MKKNLVNIGFENESYKKIKELVTDKKQKVSNKVSNEKSIDLSSDDVQSLEDEIRQKTKLLELKKKEQEIAKLEKEKQLLEEKRKPVIPEIIIEDDNSVALSFIDNFNLSVCPECYAKLRVSPTKRVNSFFQQKVKCKKCNFEKEIVVRI